MNKTERLFAIPAPGRRVVDPVTRQPLPAEGALVERSIHWLRRLREGDITEGKAPKAAAPARTKE